LKKLIYRKVVDPIRNFPFWLHMNHNLIGQLTYVPGVVL
jgi:hypothetical protein